MRRLGAVCTALAACLMLALPLSADILVMQDGSRVETKGPWKVRGNTVVFTTVRGTLSSVRLSEVDLDASEAATNGTLDVDETAEAEAAAEAQAQAEVEARKPVLILTNENVRRAAPPPSAEDVDGAAADADAGAAAPAAGATAADADAAPATNDALEVVSWRAVRSNQVDGLELFGTLRNSGSQLAAGVAVLIKINDLRGEPLLETNAFLRSNALGPGKTTSFRAVLPGIDDVEEAPDFEITSSLVEARAPQRSVDN
ncbi:MAG: hypothetical protein AAF772_00900 [Acidobacteriota bacterium]